VRNAGYVQNNNKKLKNINYISLHFLLIFICVLMKKFLVGNFVWYYCEGSAKQHKNKR